MPDRSMGDLDRVFSDYGPVLWLALLAAFLLLLLLYLRLQAQVSRMGGHYARLVRGGPGRGLEELLERHLDRMETTAERVEQLDELCQQLERTLQHAIQRVGIVRFNPFSDTGGDQSFSIALLDGAGDGLVISSLFGRAETRVFAKPVQSGQSKYTLTGEEQEAIQLAGPSQTAGAR
jgi:Protein of unknown function (DUF4446)